MYRPEGWDSVSIAMHAKVRQDSTTLVDMVEAGADAMHEADIEWILKHIILTEHLFSKAGKKLVIELIVQVLLWEEFTSKG